MNQPHHPRISAILAMSENRVIGNHNQLPWRLPADLRHFKAITSGHPILMGRKTFESIGRPLPNRLNIILTRDKRYLAEGCEVVSSIEDAMKRAEATGSEEIFIIGGAEIYRQLLPQTECIYMTLIHHPFEGDAFFPPLEEDEWKAVEEEHHEPEGENHYAYSFIKYQRR